MAIAYVDLSNVMVDMPQANNVKCNFSVRSDCVELEIQRGVNGEIWPIASVVKYEFRAHGEDVEVTRRVWSQTVVERGTTSGISVSQWNEKLPK